MTPRRVAGAGQSEAKEAPVGWVLTVTGASLPLVAPAPATPPSLAFRSHLSSSDHDMPLPSTSARTLLIIAVAICASCLARDARATCGDYLFHASTTAETASEPTVSVAADDGKSSGPTAPCEGPECRSNHRTPLAPTAPLEWNATPERACFGPAGAPTSPKACRFAQSKPTDPIAGYPQTIDRPPRTI